MRWSPGLARYWLYISMPGFKKQRTSRRIFLIISEDEYSLARCYCLWPKSETYLALGKTYTQSSVDFEESGLSTRIDQPDLGLTKTWQNLNCSIFTSNHCWDVKFYYGFKVFEKLSRAFVALLAGWQVKKAGTHWYKTKTGGPKHTFDFRYKAVDTKGKEGAWMKALQAVLLCSWGDSS